MVDRGVLLAARVVNLGVREERVDAESAGLIGDDRHDAVSEVLRAEQLLEQPHERHRGRDLLGTGALLRGGVCRIVGQVDLGVFAPTFRQIAAEGTATLVQVLDRLVVLVGLEVRREVGVLLELRIRDRHVRAVAESLEVVEGELLHLVGRIAALEARAEGVALHRLRQDDGGLALVLGGCLESRVHLSVVVAAALEVPNVVVGVALDKLERTGVTAEEVLPHIGTALGLVGLVVTVGRGVHQVAEGAVGVAGE